MTAISATSAGQQAAASDVSKSLKKETLDYDSFLKLLVAQMQNQDPLKPMDSTEYVAQLASFSNVEQGLKMNEKLDRMLVLSNLGQANTAVGMKITSADGQTSGIVSSVKVLDSGATAILNNGKEVTIESGVTIGG